MKADISNLPKYIKEARELAILGGYKKSLTIYKKIFQIMEDRINEIPKEYDLIEKWNSTKNKIKKECGLILELYQDCKIFAIEDEKDEKKKIDEEKYNNNFFMREFDINKNNNNNNKKSGNKKNDSKRWEHFGGKPPFSYLKEKNENKNITKSVRLDEPNNYRYNDQSNNNNYIVNNYVNINFNNENNYNNNINNDNINYLNQFYEDPDVWTSPEDDPRFPYQKINNSQAMKRRSVNYSQKMDLGVVNEKNLEKRRKNYEKPWQISSTSNNKSKDVNQNQKNNKNSKYNYGRRKTMPNIPNKDKKDINNKKLKKGPPKSPFLLARYPEDEGNGPDTKLIEMVEREVVDMNPNVSFDDIAELETAKRALIEAVVLPLLMPDFFVGLRRPWKGVLLYGPPGTGKTLLAKALATQGKTTFFNVSPTTFASKWKGESEKLVRILFEMARFYAPSTIFIDEVDSVGTKRHDNEHEASKKMLAEMLVQMDGISEYNSNDIDNGNNNEEIKQKFVMVLGATNLPWDLDDALRRRFEKRIYIPLPNSEGRRQMFDINFKGIKLNDDIDIDTLIKKTEGYSGHDISSVCREASLMNMRRKLMSANGKFDILQASNNEMFLQELEAPVSQDDVLTAIKNISKSVSSNDVKKFEEWTYLYSNK